MNTHSKKIIFTVINDLSYDRRMERICTSLAQNGCQVMLVGRKLHNSKPLQNKSYEQKRVRCWVNKGAFFYLEYNIRLFWLLLFAKADIFGAIDLDTILPNKWVASLKNKVWVYDAHEYFTEVIEIQNRKTVKKIWQMIEKHCLNSTTKGYTVSQSYAQLFFQKYGTKLQLVRNCPPNIPFIAQEKYPEFTFVYVGAVNEGRGLEQCIEAVQGLEAQLLICGDGDVLQELQSKVSEKKYQNIRFTGYLPPQELEIEIAKSHVGLLLLKAESLSYVYSLANKFFDYVHAQVPQIVVDFPEYKKLNEVHQVALLSDISITQIRTNMKLLLEDTDKYNLLKNNTLLAKKEWNWQEEEKTLLYFYTQL